MGVVERILDDTGPGTVTAVVGRPGAGVSTLLGALCQGSGRGGVATVLASWEAPPSITARHVDAGVVRVPDFVAWDVADLECWLAAGAVGGGSVVAVDYLQLCSPAEGLAPLVDLARRRRLRLLAGVMAPRPMAVLATAPPAALAVRVVGGFPPPGLGSADRAVVVCGEGNQPRTVCMSLPPVPGRLRWHAGWGI